MCRAQTSKFHSLASVVHPHNLSGEAPETAAASSFLCKVDSQAGGLGQGYEKLCVL